MNEFPGLPPTAKVSLHKRSRRRQRPPGPDLQAILTWLLGTLAFSAALAWGLAY